jgi:ubiquinone/menaquinone biosynthesis C-methylase UbiE
MHWKHGVRKYYAEQGVSEWKRLARDKYHQLEFLTTMRFLRKHLPKRGFVLDAGGGPGRYSIELAKRGYRVVLLDFTPELLEIARRQAKKAGVEKKIEFVEGVIEDLSPFDSSSFDAVLCTGGPLSHVMDAKLRREAALELARVVKRGAPVFVSVLSRFGILAGEMANFPHEMEMPLFKRVLDAGDYFGGFGFAPCHFFLPEELRELMEDAGLKTREMVSLEGLASYHRRAVNKLSERRWRIWLETHFKTCTQPSVLGYCEHFLLVGRKP